VHLHFNATAGVVGTAELTKNSHGVDEPARGNVDNGSISTTEAWRAIR